MRWILVLIVVTGLAVSGAVAGNVINEHSGYYQENVHYTIVDDGFGNDLAVRINAGSVSTHVWKFEAYDSGSNEPGYINFIRIDPTDTVGSIKLSIVGSAGHTYGAADVKEIDLTTNADDTTEIVELKISGDLATTANVSCTNITGEIEIGGDLDGHNIVVADDIDEDITIDGLLAGNITADSMENLTITGTNAQTGDHTGNITINGQYTEEITIGTDGGVAHPSLARDGGAIFLGRAS